MTLSREDFEGLRRSYLFSGLEQQEFLEVVDHAAPVSLHAGQLLFSQSEAVHSFYWVREGIMRLYRVSPQGDEKVIELIGANRLFAEAVLFMGGHYPVNAMAQTGVHLVAIDGNAFKAWLAGDAQRCFRLMAGMSMRLHKMVNEIDGLTLMKGADRLMQYLLDHSDPDEQGRMRVEWEAPKQVIASRIGVKPETLSRLLHKLTGQGCIAVEEKALYIRDPERMREGQFEE